MKAFLIMLSGLLAAHALGQDAPTAHPADPLEIGSRLQALLPAAVLLIGEQHDATEHQQLQAAVVTHLASKDRLHALVLEMADQGRDTQGLPASASPEVVQQRLAWNDAGWPWERYGQVVMAAVQAGVPVYGGNLPRASMRTAMRNEALDLTIPAEKRPELEALIHTAHCELLPASQLPGMARIQIGRDVAMAETVSALKQPDKVVVLVTGRQHARKDHGVPWHLGRIDASLPMSQIKVLDLRTPGAEPLASDAVWLTPPVPPQDHCAGLRERFQQRTPATSP